MVAVVLMSHRWYNEENSYGYDGIIRRTWTRVRLRTKFTNIALSSKPKATWATGFKIRGGVRVTKAITKGKVITKFEILSELIDPQPLHDTRIRIKQIIDWHNRRALISGDRVMNTWPGDNTQKRVTVAYGCIYESNSQC